MVGKMAGFDFALSWRLLNRPVTSSPKSWIFCRTEIFAPASNVIAATIRPAAFPAWTNIFAWPSPNSPIGKVSTTSRSACEAIPPSCITWAFAHAHAWPEAPWPTPMNTVIGASGPISPKSSLPSHGPIMPMTISALNFKSQVYALDSSTIDLCLSLFPWAKFQLRHHLQLRCRLRQHYGCYSSHSCDTTR